MSNKVDKEALKTLTDKEVKALEEKVVAEPIPGASESLGIKTLTILYIPGINVQSKLVVGAYTKQGVVTINEFRGADADGLLSTLTNPRIQKIVNGRKKK